MYKVVVLPLAKDDISKGADWYNSKQEGLGRRFIQDLRIKVQHIRNNPKTSAIRYDNVRTAVLGEFPFMIHYSIDDDNSTIIIAAVFHTSLNPNIWKSR